MHPVIESIIEAKKRDVQRLYQTIKQNPTSTLAELHLGKHTISPTHALEKRLKQPGMQLIAEFKRHSPTVGALSQNHTLREQLQTYIAANVAGVSVLTETTHFKGDLTDLTQAAQQLKPHGIPLLRKDFIIDEIQLAETAEMGANAALLIVGITGLEIKRLLEKAENLGLEVLLEVHTPHELAYALTLPVRLIGINNRNLKTFEVNTQHALNLYQQLQQQPGIDLTQYCFIAESGFRQIADIQPYAAAGFSGILVGSALMQHETPSTWLEALKQT